MLKKLPPSEDANYIREKLSEIGKNPKRPLGKLNPWAWFIEPVRGCNLSCAFCTLKLIQKTEKAYKFITKETWGNILEVIAEVSPFTKLEMANAGEPTLHPELLDLIAMTRKRLPRIQITSYTNGVRLMKGEITYRQLFDAGLNMIFVDMYSPLEKHQKLAEASGEEWYYKYDKKPDQKDVFTNHAQKDPDIKLICLAENPGNWPNRRFSAGRYHTFLNDLDWPVAKKMGLEPVKIAPKRRCDQANRHVNINWDGTYLFCCFDMLRNSVNNFGNINNGLEDFMEF